MVSTRRNSSGSFSTPNNAKRSSSSEEKPPSPSPKRQKVDNGAAASEKPSSPAENSKEISTPEPPADPGKCGQVDAQIDGGVAADAKTDATPPIAEGSSPTLVADKPRASFSSWSIYQKQNPNVEGSAPWCRLLSQSAQNSNVAICTSNFTIGSSRNCTFPIKDHTISGNLCKIKHTQDEELLASWTQQIDRDVETLKMKGNLHHLRTVLSRFGMECEGLETLCIKDLTLTNENAEKIVGWALSHYLMKNLGVDPDANIVLSCERKIFILRPACQKA